MARLIVATQVARKVSIYMVGFICSLPFGYLVVVFCYLTSANSFRVFTRVDHL